MKYSKPSNLKRKASYLQIRAAFCFAIKTKLKESERKKILFQI